MLKNHERSLIIGGTMLNIAPESIRAETNTALAEARKILRRILKPKKIYSVDNVLKEMNQISILLNNVANRASVLENAHPDLKIREAAEKCSQRIDKFATSLSLNRPLYDAVMKIDISGVDEVTKYFYEETLRDFRQSGVDKDDATRALIQKLSDELTVIGQKFDRNIRDGKRSILVDPKDLEGLPDDYIASHKPNANGKIEITTDYPDYDPFIRFCKNPRIRLKLFMEFENRAHPKNEAVLMSLATKRHELATILGYENWAEYVLEDKMAKNPETVQAFIDRLAEATKDRAKVDHELLLAQKRKEFPDAETLEDWERHYYDELLSRDLFDFDSSSLRPYFSYQKVRDGILGLTERLFGLEYRPVKDADTWHESVETFDVFEDGKRIGRFYLDMHPRDGKYNHAAQFTWVGGVKDLQLPEAVLLCNFPGDTEPGLMSHREVETFLHEFGHLLHEILGGNQEWADFSGVATEWDFVEAPSHMLEEWAVDAKTLQTFAEHYETGETIPTELVDKLNKSMNTGKGSATGVQNFYSACSLAIYSTDPKDLNIDKLWTEKQLRYSPTPRIPGTHMYSSFGHLEGYSAIYYTYMWSLVIAKDLFSKFDQNDLLDPKVSIEYRKKILEPGGSKEAATLISNFLGRPYNFEAFASWLNKE